MNLRVAVLFLTVWVVLIGYTVEDSHALDFSLPDTGQTKCYDNEKEILCPLPGEHFHGQDAQYEGFQPAYQDNGNGTVTDIVTGLMWQQADDGVERTYQAAIDYCAAITLGGHDDWRLPNVFELESIVNAGTYSPCINTDVFQSRLFPYGSSSLHANKSGARWGVGFNGGGVGSYYDEFLHVRCVRSGSSALDDMIFSDSYSIRNDWRSTGNAFIDHGNGTVSDMSTGLIWQQVDDGQKRTWQDALAYCENLNLGEHDNWRLPDRRELLSLIDFSALGPAINDDVFECRSSDYWSSSSYPAWPMTAFQVSFVAGNVSNHLKTEADDYVRCVSGGHVDDLVVFIESGDTIQSGMDKVTPGRVIIKVAQGTYPENLVADQYGVYQLMGGYDSGFVQQTGVSIIDGSLTINNGIVVVENIVIKK